MKHTIARTILLDERDVCQAICDYLKSKGIPSPHYIASVPEKGVTWTHQPLDVKIEWHEELEAH